MLGYRSLVLMQCRYLLSYFYFELNQLLENTLDYYSTKISLFFIVLSFWGGGITTLIILSFCVQCLEEFEWL